MAVTWMDDALFVLGGHVGPRHEPPGISEYEQDAFVYDPSTESWRSLQLPERLCDFGRARAIWVDGQVVVYGQHGPGDCDAVALYDPSADSWETISPGFSFRADSPVAWTGELLVFPIPGLAWDPATGEGIQVPALAAAVEVSSSSPVVALWTSTHVAAIGADSLFLWQPGEEVWVDGGVPPVPVIARDSAMTSSGLVLVNYQMAAAWWTAADGWVRRGDLPLRFYECLPRVVSAGGTPVVQMCSGTAVWDEVGGFWVPVPLEDVTGWYSGHLVGADEALYSVGPRFRRFQIERDEGGRVVPPLTIPIGVMQLDLPDGFALVSSFAPHQTPDGVIPDDETIGVLVRSAAGTTCDVASTYGTFPSTRYGHLDEIGSVAVYRPGREPLAGTAYRNPDGYIGLAFTYDNGSDTVFIICREEGTDLAATIAQGLWSPWEDDSERLLVPPDPAPTVVS
jgi:hypothetical protein